MRFDITHARVQPDDVALLVEKLEPYTQNLQKITETNNIEAPEASIVLPSDLAQREVVEALHQELVGDELKYVFLVGIGGSNLGAKAIYDGLIGYQDSLTSTAKPKVIFIDTNESVLLESVLTLIESDIDKPEEFLCISISKSGGTTETIFNTEVLLACVLEKFGDAAYERVVGITGEESAFDTALFRKNIRRIYIPHSVGGRFSVFSPVGLFPLLVSGVDIDAVLAGALSMRNACVLDEFSSNIALQSAVVSYLNAQQKKTIHTHFIFRPQLESLGKWYRQLLGESIGKYEDREGNVINSGLTPDISIGSTDLHSMAQLYLAGPHDKFTTFIRTEQSMEGVDMPQSRQFEDIVPHISGKNTEDVMHAIYQGVTKAYEKASRPFAEIVLEDISPYEIGAFMQFKMIEMMYLGELFNVNPFNQPQVELYKVETKAILDKK